MLPEFATEQDFDSGVMERIAEAVDLYQRQRRFIIRNNNTVCTDSNKQIAKDTKERFDALHAHIRSIILDLVGGDVQTAYNYLVDLVRQNRCAEGTVWAVLDELILCVIPYKPYHKEVAA